MQKHGQNMKGAPPTVSIVVPCRNEKDHIEVCLRSILAQDPPRGAVEIIVADGMSDDGTRDILQKLASMDQRLKIVDNPELTTAHGMNAGIRKARGQYIAILGAHCEYAPDYIRKCVELLDERPEVCCSGGPIVSRGRGLFGRALAAAMSHPLGVGNAQHRFPNYEGYAEGACFPMFRKEVFDTVGLYDERLVRNQDDDFNYRVARAGGKIFISPRAWCCYYVREAPLLLFSQYFQYGYWRVAVLKKHHRPATIRQVVPILFFLLILVLLVSSLYLPGQWRLIGTALPVAYASILILSGVGIAKKHGPLIGLIFPIAAAIMHLAYAAGFGWGVINGKSTSAASASSSEGWSHEPRSRRREVL